MNNITTYSTKYGLITLYNNDFYIHGDFMRGGYWDEDNLIKIKPFIDENRNILEIGGHCGTSTLVYSKYTKKQIFVFEPQENMYNLLIHNIKQNNLCEKIIPYNKGVFCFTGDGKMNNIDLDGGLGKVDKRYNEENHLPCNFGGITLGNNGENISLTTIDDMKLDDIGFIHCDAQGSENFIFSKAIDTISKNRPVIYYENNNGNYLQDSVCNSYKEYKDESMFNIKDYCMNVLKYSQYIHSFNGGDDLLIP